MIVTPHARATHIEETSELGEEREMVKDVERMEQQGEIREDGK